MENNEIESVINGFDFERVRRYMTDAGWAWAGVGIPSVPVLQGTARELLRSVMHSPDMLRAETGGLSAMRLPWGELRLDFCISGYSLHSRNLRRAPDPVTAELVEVLAKLTEDSMAGDFNEHWDSYKEARALLAAQTKER